MWERYCRGVNAIIFMVDAADHAKLDAAKNELMQLLDKPQLEAIPVLVLGNKRDLVIFVFFYILGNNLNHVFGNNS